ncbi:MAG: hypothetical protein HZB91_05205 [Elusimicrobia bacterium]|nr:hypothetical protein [Elusimicrobiota bacterium]
MRADPCVWPLAALAALSLQGCSSWGLGAGSQGDGEVVEASGPDLTAAKRNAVASLFGLFLSSASLPAAQAVLDEKILARAPFFIRKHKVLQQSAAGGAVIRAVVRVGSLGSEIERLDLDAGLGPKGKARILIAMSEEGGAACRLCDSGGPKEGPDGFTCRDAGCASEALRRALVRRGFSAYDLSDRLNPVFTKDGGSADPRAAARDLAADILIQGSARASAVQDDRLTRPDGAVPGYRVGRGTLDLSAELLSRKETVPVKAEATAVDMSEASAFAKALENVGDKAGDALAEHASAGWKVDSEMSLVVVGLKDLGSARRVINDLRALPELRSVALSSHLPPETRLRVRTGLAADQLASIVLGMRSYGFNVLAVGSDLVEVEVLRERDDGRERDLF